MADTLISTSQRLYYGWERRTLALSSSAARVSRLLSSSGKRKAAVAEDANQGGTGQMIQALAEDKIDVVSCISPTLMVFRQKS